MLLLFFCLLPLLSALYFDDVDLAVPNPTLFTPIYGSGAGYMFGYTVNNIGDVNGDGIDDLIIGSPTSIPAPGFAYVIYGHKDRIPNTDLSTLTINQGFRIQGEGPSDFLGCGAGSAGDFNGDGIGDMIVGAPYIAPGGAAYVIFGSRIPLPNINLPTDLAGRGFKISETQTPGLLGKPVTCAGDVNGDGLDDLIIGAYNEGLNGPYSGTVYVIFGRTSGITDLNVPGGLTSDRGFYICGQPGDMLGVSAAGAGDINGDGIADIIIGTYNSATSGDIYIIYGRKTGFPNYMMTSTYSNTEVNRIQGEFVQSFLGFSSSKAGDVNGDGVDDLVLSATGYYVSGKLDIGAVYVIFGRKNGHLNMNLATDFDNSKGFAIYGANTGDSLGSSVSNVGDFNGDGIDDILIGASRVTVSTRNSAGSAYLIYGRRTGFSNIDLAAGLQKMDGFTIKGTTQYGYFGMSLSDIGDFNGDGGSDMIVGAMYDDNPLGVKTGAAYIFYGIPFPFKKPIEVIAEVQSAGAIANQAAAMVLFFGEVNNGLPLLFSFLVEILYYVRYLEIRYPPRLRYMLEQPEPEYMSVNYITSAPEQLIEFLPGYNIPAKFELYGFYSSFLINFWTSIIMFLIVLVIIILALLLEYGTRSKKWLNDKCIKFKQSMKWNYLIAMFTGYFSDIALNTFLETRTVKFGSFLEGISFIICIMTNVLAGFMLIKMFLIIRKVRAATEQIQIMKTSNPEELDKLKSKLQDFEVIFKGYKGNSFIQQSYLLLFSARFYLFYVVVSYLYAHPIVQTSIISVMGLVTLIYVTIKRPFEDKKDLVMSLVQETILQIVNISAFVLAVTDGEDKETDGVRVVFGDIIIGCNVVFMAVGLTYTIIKLALLFKDFYTYIKKICIMKREKSLSKHWKPKMRNNISDSSQDISSLNETHHGLTLNASSFIDQSSTTHVKSELHLIEAPAFPSKTDSRRLRPSVHPKMNKETLQMQSNFNTQKTRLHQQQPVVHDHRNNSGRSQEAKSEYGEFELISNLDNYNYNYSQGNRMKSKNVSPFSRRDKTVHKYN